MRYLVVSDMHGNWDAFKRVIRKVRRKRFDSTLVLGDLVGYGAAPNQVMDEVRSLPGKLHIVRGNHDKVAAGIESGDDFNDVALTSARWTAERLTKSNHEALRQLPIGPTVVETGTDGRAIVAICHGSPADEDVYLFSDREALEAFDAEPRSYVTFFGHTHLPSMFVLHQAGIRGALLRGDGELRLHPRMRYLINPGSIGQPRDRDPKASYMIFDSRQMTLKWRRLRYPVGLAQKRIHDAGLPAPLADRLAEGI